VNRIKTDEETFKKYYSNYHSGNVNLEEATLNPNFACNILATPTE